MKKDILFLCQFFYPSRLSSAILPYETAKALVQEGFTVDVITGKVKRKDVKTPKKEEINGINIKRLTYYQGKSKKKIPRLISYATYILANYINIFKFKKYKVIIVYSNPPILPKIALLANKWFGTKIIYVSYDVYPEISNAIGATKKNGLISKSMNRINKKLFMRSSAVIALSNEMKEFMIQNRDVDPNIIHVIPNWHEDLIPKNNDFEISHIFSSFKRKDDMIVSYFGNLGPLQNVEAIIETAKIIKEINPNIKFLIAGHGSKVNYVLNEIIEYELTNVCFHNFLEGDDFKSAIKLTDINIVSLIDEATGLAVPSKTYSYYMSGKPVIALMNKNTDIYKEIKKNNAGTVISNNSVKRLVEELLHLYENPAKVLEMGNKARNLYLNKYTVDINTRKYCNLAKEILKE